MLEHNSPSPYILIVMLLVLIGGGCAKDTHKPAFVEIQPIDYQGYTCDQLEEIFSTLGRGWKDVSELPGKTVEISMLTEAKAVMSAAEVKKCQLMLQDFKIAKKKTENTDGGSAAIKICVAIGTAAMFFVTKRNMRRLAKLARKTCLSLLV